MKKYVRVIVTKYYASEGDLLLQNLREKYFINIDCQVLPFKVLCEDLKILSMTFIRQKT